MTNDYCNSFAIYIRKPFKIAHNSNINIKSYISELDIKHTLYYYSFSSSLSLRSLKAPFKITPLETIKSDISHLKS